jgi:imidazolonepropionase-like amidohydrolase
MVRRTETPMTATVVLENATLLDVERGELRGGTSVLIEGDRIREVSERRLGSASAERIDVRGRTLMPGLIDAHVHATITTMDMGAMARRPAMLVSQEARVILEGMLRRGFTTVRDVGGADHGLARAIERGFIRGPRPFPLRARRRPGRRPRADPLRATGRRRSGRTSSSRCRRRTCR